MLFLSRCWTWTHIDRTHGIAQTTESDIAKDVMKGIGGLFARALTELRATQQRASQWSKTQDENSELDAMISSTRVEIEAMREKILATPPNAKEYNEFQQEKLKLQQKLVCMRMCCIRCDRLH